MTTSILDKPRPSSKPHKPEDVESRLAALEREVSMLRSHDRDVRELGEEIAKLENQEQIAKSQHAAKKKELDEAYRLLAEKSRERPSFGPLYDQASGGTANGNGKA